MYLVLFLFEALEIIAQPDEPTVVSKAGRAFADVCTDWAESLYLGFYDWVRTAQGDILGVTLIIHDGRELLRDLLPKRSYIQWLSPDIVRIIFRQALIDEASSVDQEFSVSRCLRAHDGSVALVFDASGLDDAAVKRLESPLTS